MVEKRNKNREEKGRNADGTFAKGNQVAVGNGRPAAPWSVREQAKIMATKNPEMVLNLVKTLYSVAQDKSNAKSIEAADKLIKLLGNYDPAELKTDFDGRLETTTSPLASLSTEELEKLRGMLNE